MQTVLANLLLAYAPLAALVGNRVHWRRMPQGQPAPNVVMHKISGSPSYTYGGPTSYAQTRVQFDCKGNTVAEAQQVAQALTVRLAGFRGAFAGFVFQGCFLDNEGQDDGVDGTSTWFVERRDFLIHWAPA